MEESGDFIMYCTYFLNTKMFFINLNVTEVRVLVKDVWFPRFLAEKFQSFELSSIPEIHFNSSRAWRWDQRIQAKFERQAISCSNCDFIAEIIVGENSWKNSN